MDERCDTYNFSGIDAVRQTKGVAEAAICYTGDLSAPNGGGKYNLEYYLKLAQVSCLHENANIC